MPRKRKAGRPRLPKDKKRKKINLSLDQETLAFLDKLIDLGLFQSRSEFIDVMAKAYSYSLEKSQKIIKDFLRESGKEFLSKEDLPKLISKLMEITLEDLEKIAIDLTSRHAKLYFETGKAERGEARKKAKKIKIEA